MKFFYFQTDIMQLLTSYDGNLTNIFVFDFANVSETIVYLVMIKKDFPIL